MFRFISKSVVLPVFLALLPFFLLVLVEAGLRLGGYGQDYSLFEAWEKGGHGAYTVNNRFYSRNFYKYMRENIDESARWGFVLDREKKEKTYRVFLFGGSVALGEDPDTAFNIPRFLEIMLKECFPEVNFEIYNLACFALGSAVMSDAAQQAAAFSPDLFLIYMGNNEYLGTMLSQWHRKGKPHKAWIIRMLYRAQQYRLVQLTRSLFPEKNNAMPAEWDLFFKTSFQLRPDSAGREEMYRNYEKHLQDMCKSAHGSGGDVLVCTVASNIAAMPPMGSVHREELTAEEKKAWEHCFSEGCASLADDPEHALEKFNRALEIDALPARLHFHRGEAYLLLNRLEEARSSFQCACDSDVYPLRADSRINALVKQCASQKHRGRVFLADIADTFAQASPSGISGQEFCYDYVHQSVEGNYTIASAIFDALVAGVAERTGCTPEDEKPDYERCCELLGLSPLLTLRCIDGILDDQEHLGTLFPAYLPGRYTALREEAVAALPEDPVDDALTVLDKALRQRGDDLVLRRLRCEILRDAGREAEMREEAQEIMIRYGDIPLGAHIARSFLETATPGE